MIGQHPSLFGFPELKLFVFGTLGELSASLSAPTPEFAHRSPGLVRAVALLVFGDQSLSSLGCALEWLRARSSWSGAQAFDVLMSLVAPRIAVEKSPEHVLHDAPLERIQRAYPRARFIHVTRHPVSSAVSMQKHMQLACDADGFAFCLYHWYDINFRAASLASSDRYLQVRAEDVLNDPEPSLQRLCAWLDVPLVIEPMLHPQRSPFASFAPAASGVRGGNDPAFLLDPVPHQVALPADFSLPPAAAVPPRLLVGVTELALRFGY